MELTGHNKLQTVSKGFNIVKEWNTNPILTMNGKKTVKNYKCLSMFNISKGQRISHPNQIMEPQLSVTTLGWCVQGLGFNPQHYKEKEVKMINFQNIREQGGTCP